MLGVVVRLRGLPIKSTAEEVLQFLGAEGLPADAVHLRCQPRRSTGEAYVVFNTLEEAQQACSKDKDIFCPKSGDRYVRVSIEKDVRPADLVATDSAATGKVAPAKRAGPKQPESVVKVGGLPRTITPPEVLSLFWGWQVRPASTYILAATDASPHVEALVEFEVQEHAALAIAQRHGTAITTAAGVFQLSVQPASKAEWDAAVAVQQGNDGILRVKGLPPRAGAPDVLAFFQGYRVKPGGVHVQPVNDKRSKVAMVEFESAAEAARALQEKNRQQFGGTDRFCLLQLASRAELEQELAHFQQQQQQQQQQRQSVPATSGKWGGSSSAGPSGIGTASGSDPGAPLPGSAGGLQSSSLAGGMPGTGGASSEANLLPQAAATAAGFLHQQPLPLPPMPMPGMPGMMPPGYMLPPGVPPMPGGWPMGPVMMGPVPMGPLPPCPMPHGFGFGHGMAAHPGAMAAAAAAASMGMPGAGGMQPWGPPGMRPFQAPNTAAARYLVQDLTTGQQVFLDPRFNLSSYGMLPPAFGSSAAATAGTTAGGTATGPARGSQQAQSELDATATSGGPAEQQPVGQAGAAAATADGSGEGSGQGPSGSGAVEAPGGAGGNGNGHSSGNGYSVAAADRHVAAMADGSGNAMLGSSRQSEQIAAGGQHGLHKHHHHNHHRHHHHHHHSHHRQHPHSHKPSSSADEGRTNGGSGGGSNDGSDNGSGGHESAAGKRQRMGPDSSSGEGSGAGPRDDGGPTAMLATAGGGTGLETGCAAGRPPAADAGASAASEAAHAAQPAAAAPAADHRLAQAHGQLQQPQHVPKDPTKLHSPPSSGALQADGAGLPPIKRTRNP